MPNAGWEGQEVRRKNGHLAATEVAMPRPFVVRIEASGGNSPLTETSRAALLAPASISRWNRHSLRLGERGPGGIQASSPAGGTARRGGGAPIRRYADSRACGGP